MDRLITVVVDTTATFADVMMSRTRWMQFLSLCAKRRIRLVVPTVVLLETARHWEGQARDALKSARKGSSALEYLNLGPLVVPEVAIDKGAFFSARREHLTGLHVEIPPLPNVGTTEILDRDLGRLKPFSTSGKGFRDTLVWCSVKELLATLDREDVVYFVTKNTDDYCKDGFLHPQLVAEVEILEIDLRHVLTLEDLAQGNPIKALIEELARTDEELKALLRAAGAIETIDAETPNVDDVIREALLSAASGLVDQEIETDLEHRFGPDFSGFDIPSQVETPTIRHVDVDPDSAEWDTYETYEDGTLLMQGSIEGDVYIEGFVHKSDYAVMDDQVDLIDFDWNDHMAFVSLSVLARLVFQLRVDSHFDQVEDVYFENAEALVMPEAETEG